MISQLRKHLDRDWQILLIVGFAFLIYSAQSINRHLIFATFAYDLGIYSQVTYLYSQFELPFSTLKHMIQLADHFELILFFISPIYRVLPNPITLLVLQALFVSLSALPLYYIFRDKLKNKSASLILVFCYLTSVGIGQAINFDFHPITLATLPISLVIYFWYFKKFKYYWITCFVSLLFKEDLPLLFLGLGVYQFFHSQKKLGIQTAIFSALSFYMIKFQIMPFILPSARDEYLNTLNFPRVHNLQSVFLFPILLVRQFFNSPIKLNTLKLLYGEYLFLPLLSWLNWLTVFPYLFLRFNSSYQNLWSSLYHHNASLTPFLFTSLAFSLDNLKRKGALLKLSLLVFLVFSLVNFYITFITPYSSSRATPSYFLEKELNKVPQEVSISAQSPLVPHLANREKIYQFPEIIDAQYIVIYTKMGTFPINKKEYIKTLEFLKNSREWKTVEDNQGFLIFNRQP